MQSASKSRIYKFYKQQVTAITAALEVLKWGNSSRHDIHLSFK
jgi:hypothetical protein